MPSFTPPTQNESVSGDRLFSRYRIPVAMSVVKVNGTYKLMPYPWQGDLVGTEGIDYFLGGRTYVISSEVSAALTADGFTPVADRGYGEGPYGSQGYGF